MENPPCICGCAFDRHDPHDGVCEECPCVRYRASGQPDPCEESIPISTFNDQIEKAMLVYYWPEGLIYVMPSCGHFHIELMVPEASRRIQ